MWVIKEGISFVHEFDRVHLALVMTTNRREAKRFGSKRDAELWVDQYGKDLGSFRILDDQTRNVKPGWLRWRGRRRGTSNSEWS
jgi:hypothetical protein